MVACVVVVSVPLRISLSTVVPAQEQIAQNETITKEYKKYQKNKKNKKLQSDERQTQNVKRSINYVVYEIIKNMIVYSLQILQHGVT